MIAGNNAPLKGLVLCGGQSTRMQENKSRIQYHGVPQWRHLADILTDLGLEVYLSCRTDQQTDFDNYPRLIPDSVPYGGPSAGLLSAHRQQPDAAWLVLACDLPLISRQSLNILVRERDVQLSATAFISPVNDLPEPLIAIWEPAGLQALLQNVEAGKNCPRKTLLNTDIRVLHNPFAAEQYNANTPEEKAAAMKQVTDQSLRL
jgi:molybdopterin-guanine dinucleotide biosynthesis protein A